LKKRLTSENGYALILTLLTFTVLMIIAISIWGIIINNSKQIHSTEKDIQSTDLAEMGFVYNYTVIDETYKSLIPGLKTFMTNRINNDINSGVSPLPTEAQYTEIAIEELYNRLTNALSTNGKLKSSEIVSLQGDNIYRILPVTVAGSRVINNISFLLDKPNYLINISFVSSGSTGSFETAKSLKLNFDIKIDKITLPGMPSDPNTPLPANPGELEPEIPPPNTGGLPPCQPGNTGTGCTTTGDQTYTNKDINVTGTTIYIGGNAQFPHNSQIDITNNSTVYVQGDANFGSTIDNITNSNLHVGGTATIDTINNISGSTVEVGVLNDTKDNVDTGTFISSIINSTIRVQQDAILHKVNAEFINSKLIVGRDLIMKNEIKSFTNNSVIKVFRDAEFSHINGTADSKVCVYGTLKSIQNYTPVKIFARKVAAGVGVPVTNTETFNRECPVEVDEIEFEWDPSTDVDYQYDYN
jgi:hypothetical protein